MTTKLTWPPRASNRGPHEVTPLFPTAIHSHLAPQPPPTGGPHLNPTPPVIRRGNHTPTSPSTLGPHLSVSWSFLSLSLSWDACPSLPPPAPRTQRIEAEAEAKRRTPRSGRRRSGRHRTAPRRRRKRGEAFGGIAASRRHRGAAMVVAS
ncbi:hypothetical protein DAI22_04g310950 [Oryza sativa Japonica Group]|nr:hypothetical protein DAI22_04g310950 [Oryza sativa Japonica Group]